MVDDVSARVVSTGICGTSGCADVTVTVLRGGWVWVQVCWDGDCKSIAVRAGEARELFSRALRAIDEVNVSE